MPKIKPISLDGSTLEGGGQLTRVALSLAAITNTPIHIHSIRANRGSGPRRTDVRTASRRASSKPSAARGKSHHNNKTVKAEGGLKESHLAALQWLAAHCDAYVEGAEVGSREITFIPGAATNNSTSSLRKQHHASQSRPAARSNLVDLSSDTITLQNPGSVWLIFQALYPFMVFGSDANAASKQSQSQSTTITLHGGTNVSKSMSADYVLQVFLPICQRIGLPETSISVVRRGWAGNAPQIGEVRITVHRPPQSTSTSTSKPTSPPFSLPAFTLTSPGAPSSIDITVLANPESTRRQLIAALRDSIAEDFGPEININIALDEDSEDPRRLYTLLVARTDAGWPLGRDFLGSGRTPKSAAELGRMLETAARTVVRELSREVRRGGVVDEFCQDQLVVFQALAGGRSVVDGGAWKGKADVLDGDEECGDEEGSLHTRTVRWVCREILKGREKGVQFRTGGECFGVGWNGPANKSSVEMVHKEMGRVNLLDDDDDDGT